MIVLILILFAPLTGLHASAPSLMCTSLTVSLMDHVGKTLSFFNSARRICNNAPWKTCLVAVGASTVISSQEITRVYALVKRLSGYSFCRRMDWFDGQARTQVLDIQLRSFFNFVLYCVVLSLSVKNCPMGQMGSSDQHEL